MINTKVKPRKIDILLVADNSKDRIRTIAELRASRVANTVHAVSDSAAALRFLRNENEYDGAPTPDLILLDLDLPRKDGPDVLAEVKGDDSLCHIPMVVLTNLAADEGMVNTWGVPPNCRITKPLDFEQFGRVIASLPDFWFEIVTLPTDPAPVKKASAQGSAHHRVGAESDVASYRALVVEDNPADRLLIEAALRESNRSVFETFVVDRVSHAQEELNGSRFDVVICGLGLPDSSGLETVRSLVKAAAGVPVIVLTALNDEDVGGEAIKEGAADYVIKGEMSGRMLGRTIRYAVDRSRIEEQMRHSQRMESLGVLAGGIAHDFNNLLMVIRGNAELQRRFGVADPRINRTSDHVLEAADRAAKLTRQMLAFGRRERVHLSNIEMNATISEFTKMIERLMGPTIALELQLCEADLTITADPSLLEQVIMNLAVNARDAMPDGGTLRITSNRVVVEPDRAGGVPPGGPGDYAMMAVEDSGSGMSRDVVDRIFEPFFTTKGVGQGTGLGLSTTYGIVRQHRGSIEVDSEPGKGSRFTVLIPCSRKNPRKPSIEADAPKRGNHETILVVDDEVLVRDLTTSFLEMNGYRVKQAESGADVIRRWEELEPQVDLVLTDLIMPEGVSGRDLGTWLSEHKPDLKVIYCSGFSRPHLDRKFKLREGMNFLAKPYSADSLLELVHRVLHSEPSNPDPCT